MFGELSRTATMTPSSCCHHTPPQQASLLRQNFSGDLRRSGRTLAAGPSSSSRTSDPEQALKRFFAQLRDQHQQQRFTFPFLLSSCGRLRARREGDQIHGLVHKLGLSGDRFVQNSLVFMYSSSRCFHHAAKVFDRMPQRDIVSWTSAIDAAVAADRPVEALRLFRRMQDDGVRPNEATLICVLKACADTGALDIGRNAHSTAERQGLRCRNPSVVTALIDMYAKCGCIDGAVALFWSAAERDVVMWTTMISGLALHGKSREALQLFDEMTELGIPPDHRATAAALSACRASGLVSEGYRIYNRMHKCGLRPGIQHHGFMADLLARAGHLQEAEEFLKGMPLEDPVMWRMLKCASKLRGELRRAERLKEELRRRLMEASHTGGEGAESCVSNICSSAGTWEEKERAREAMARRRVGKLPGCSRVQVAGAIHEFETGGGDHPEAELIIAKAAEMEKLSVECSLLPELAEIPMDAAGEEEETMRRHSEMFAVAYGLMSTTSPEKIVVVKNLRTCEGCHGTMKLVSKIYGREITVRDRIKFHHFKDGGCSCGDYW